MSWQVAIPSYARAGGLNKWTLATLQKGGVPADRITVFVATEEQRALYERTMDARLYNDLVVAQPGIREARNVITRYYRPGTSVVSVDDDLRRVAFGDGGQLTAVSDIPAFFDECFGVCEKIGARIWGVYPVCNAFYMKGVEVTTDLRPLIGPLHGYITDPDIVLECGVKEDIEKTIRYYAKDGVIARFNRYAADQPPHAPGGLQATSLRTVEESAKAADFLCRTWPQWVRRKADSSRGHAEVQLSSKGWKR